MSPEEYCAHLLAGLRQHADPANIEGMARFGISSAGTLGVSMPEVRALGRQARREHRADVDYRHMVAACLWATGVHEARILATIVEEPDAVTPEQALSWARDVDSWDVCDQLCMNLLRKTPLAWDLVAAWTGADEEFVRRAGFVLIATLAVHAKNEPDSRFEAALALIPAGAADERPLVHKAANWALRQVGKRGGASHRAALDLARELAASEHRSTRWVGRDAARELEAHG